MKAAVSNTHRATPRSLARLCTWFALAFTCLASGSPVRGAAAAARSGDAPVMIIGERTPITDIPASVVRAAFRGLPTEYEGQRLIPLNPPQGTPVREVMDRALLGLSRDAVGRFWVDQRVRDGRTPPRTVPNPQLAVRVVAQLPGTITCVPARLTTPAVRVLRIDGKGPADRGYLFAL
jgi:hypothetical protein